LYPEMKEMYSEKTGKFSIPKSKMGSTIYDYEMVSGSTYAVDQKEQQANLSGILELYMQNPEMVEGKFQQEGKEFRLGELLTRIISNSGIQDWDKIIVDTNEGQGEGENVEQVIAQAEDQFMQGVQDMVDGNQQGAANAAMGAPTAVNQTPPTV